VNANDILEPHERLIFGMDTARGPDECCEVTAIYDTLTGKIRIIDVEYESRER
jgi:hypothetical protein